MKANKDKDNFQAFSLKEHIIEKPFERQRNDTIDEESFEESETENEWQKPQELICTDIFEVTEMAASSFEEQTRTSEKKKI